MNVLEFRIINLKGLGNRTDEMPWEKAKCRIEEISGVTQSHLHIINKSIERRIGEIVTIFFKHF